jgi:hypothetical protein
LVSRKSLNFADHILVDLNDLPGFGDLAGLRSRRCIAPLAGEPGRVASSTSGVKSAPLFVELANADQLLLHQRNFLSFAFSCAVRPISSFNCATCCAIAPSVRLPVTRTSNSLVSLA